MALGLYGWAPEGKVAPVVRVTRWHCYTRTSVVFFFVFPQLVLQHTTACLPARVLVLLGVRSCQQQPPKGSFLGESPQACRACAPVWGCRGN